MGKDVARVLFVCTGNICRSPTAEGVFSALVERAGLGPRIEVDSAGTIDFHAGEPPDPRSQRAAARRGYHIAGLRARMLRADDYERFDVLVALGADHERFLRARCAPAQAAKIRRLLEFAPERREIDVPDPYGGGAGGFELVLDMVEEACAGLLAHVRQELLH